MYSAHDTPKGWVAPFGHLGIKARSRLPPDFRSVPRPSSPPGAKASTECPSHTHPALRRSRSARHHRPSPGSRPKSPNPRARTAKPAMHRNHPRQSPTRPKPRKPRASSPVPRQGHSQHTLKTPLNAAAAARAGPATRLATHHPPSKPVRSPMPAAADLPTSPETRRSRAAPQTLRDVPRVQRRTRT